MEREQSSFGRFLSLNDYVVVVGKMDSRDDRRWFGDELEGDICGYSDKEYK